MATNFPNTAGAGQGLRGVNQNRANDDKTNKKKTGTVKQTPIIPAVSGALDETLAETNRLANAGNAGTAGPTQAGKADTVEAKISENKFPDKRLKNPLANFSSYTYQLSLYMITPDAYEAFILDGRRNLNAIKNITAAGQETIDQANQTTAEPQPRSADGTTTIGTNSSNSSPPAPSSVQTIKRGAAYLIAQSGGINNSGPNERAPGFDVDFYIDDLMITQSITGKETQSATNVTDISFKITEPYGFSFISRLRRAQDELKQRCPTPGYGDTSNPVRQFYILGIRFLGYDNDGNVIDPAKLQDMGGTGIGLYERYYDIVISKMDFRLGGQSVVYNCEAKSIPGSEAFDTKKGIVWSGASITASTVYDALIGGNQNGVSKAGGANGAHAGTDATQGAWGLLSTLNKEQQTRLDNKEIEYANEWDIEFLGEAKDIIAKASMLSQADRDKRRMPTSTSATSTEQSNAVTAQTGAKPNNNLKTISVGTGIPIIQAVDEIIKQSAYLEDALSIIKKSRLDNTGIKKESSDVIDNSNKTVTIKWYTISAEVVVKAWDKKQNDFVFKTKFIVQPYSTPVSVGAYSDMTTPYYGPHKRYEYWFTGKNTEVLKFEQTFNNAFYNVVLDGAGISPSASGNGFSFPVAVGQPTGQARQGRPNYNMETQNSYISSLYDPSAWAETNISILGDPDFLMQPAASSINDLYDEYYGTDGYTVSANGGQVFVEINFKEPKDYNNDTGTMDINQSINIYPHPKYIQTKINERGGGVSIMLIKVVSKFNKGTFIQDLTGVPGIFADDPVEESREAESPFAAFSQVKTVPIVQPTNSGTGATATASAAKANQTKARTGTTAPSVPKFTPGGNAKRGGVYNGTAPTTTGQGTTVKNVASAEIARNLGVNNKTLLPLNVTPISKPVQDQTKLNNKGVQNDDAGDLNPRQRR